MSLLFAHSTIYVTLYNIIAILIFFVRTKKDRCFIIAQLVGDFWMIPKICIWVYHSMYPIIPYNYASSPVQMSAILRENKTNSYFAINNHQISLINNIGFNINYNVLIMQVNGFWKYVPSLHKSQWLSRFYTYFHMIHVSPNISLF